MHMIFFSENNPPPRVLRVMIAEVVCGEARDANPTNYEK